MRVTVLAVVFGLCAFICLGAAQNDQNQSGSTQDNSANSQNAENGSAKQAWEAPADAAAKPNPGGKNPDAAAAGRKLFMRSCAGCHEADGSGKDTGAADLRSPAVQAQSDGALFWKVSTGNLSHGMPSFGRLPEQDRWDVVTFLRTFKSAAGKDSGSKQPSGDDKGASSPPPQNHR
jgi:mono/diheme cytochrome c family protein